MCIITPTAAQLGRPSCGNCEGQWTAATIFEPLSKIALFVDAKSTCRVTR
jgi:hypothetical protein